MSEQDHRAVPPTPTPTPMPMPTSPTPPSPPTPPTPPLSVGAAARQGFRQAYAEQKKDFLPELGRGVVDDARWLALEALVAIALVGVLALLGGLVGAVTFGVAPGALIGVVVGIAVYCVLRFVVFGAAVVLGIKELRRR